jgi:hypothetical protein
MAGGVNRSFMDRSGETRRSKSAAMNQGKKFISLKHFRNTSWQNST